MCMPADASHTYMCAGSEHDSIITVACAETSIQIE